MGTRRQFSREFKLEAVRLVKERGVSVAQASRDLDVHENDCAFTIHHEHAGRRGLDRHPELLDGTLPLGDVDHRAQDEIAVRSAKRIQADLDRNFAAVLA